MEDGELIGENGHDCAFVIHAMGEAEEEEIGARVGVLGRVDPREVLVLNDHRAVRWIFVAAVHICNCIWSQGSRNIPYHAVTGK
jgi:hypothetical protein